METNKLEYVGAYSPEKASIIFENFNSENIEFFGEEDMSVHDGNSPFDKSPGRSSDIEIHKIFVHNRDIKRALTICEELFGKST